MKTKFYLLPLFCLISFTNFSQVKIFPGGTTVVGDLNLTPSASKLTVIGNSTFLKNNSSPIVSAAFIRGGNDGSINSGYSSPSNPDYSWWGNDLTGIFHPGPNIIGFGISNTERVRIHSNGKSYFSAAPNTGSPWLDGVITGKNFNDNERIFSGTHTSASNNWGQAVNIDLSRPLSVGYRCIAPGTLGWYVTGVGWTFSAGSYIGSDQAIKTNISTITNAVQTIKNLRGVKYNLLGEISNPSLYEGGVSQYYGFLAQETQTAIPGNGVVKTGENGTFRYISYDQIIPFLVEAVKELKSSNDSLKHQADSLQKQITDCCTKSNNGNHNGHRLNNPDENTSQNYDGASYVKQNNPNPFSRETFIEYLIIERDAFASIMVFDMNGKLLKTFKINGNGKGTLNISGNEFQPGMYFYSLVINNKEIDTKKMILTE